MTAKKTSERNPSSVGNACCAVALSVMLAGQLPVGGVAYADAGEASVAGVGESADVSGAQAAAGDADISDAIDISAEWGKDGLTLSKAGRYVLSADVKGAGTLSVAAPKGEAIELDLAGHTVEFADSAVRGIDVSASAGTVRIVNSKPAYRDGAREKTAGNLAASLVMKTVDPKESVYAVCDNAAKREKGQDAPAIAFENIAIDVSARVSTARSLACDVAGVYVATRDVAADAADGADVALKGCAISVSVDAKDDAAREALAIGCGGQGETGSAYALFTACKGVALDGSMSLAASGLADAGDIASSADDALAFGRDFECESALRANVKGNADGTVLGHVSDDFDLGAADRLAFEPAAGDVSFALDGRTIVVHANAADAGAGEGAVRADAPALGGAGEQGAVQAELGDAAANAVAPTDPVLAASEEQIVALSGEGAIGRRALEREIELADVSSPRATATLVRDGKEKGTYATVDEALSKMASGDTLRLDGDVDNLVFAKDGNTLVSYTIDLAGHTATQLSVSSQAQVAITSSAPGGTIGGSGLSGAALTYSGAGKLTVQGIGVSSYSGSVKACGISVTGAGRVVLDDVDIDVSAQGVEARGINQTSKTGGAITATGGSVRVSTQTANVAVYGITTAAPSKTLALEDCPVTVAGSTAAACGIDSKGIVSVKGVKAQAAVSVSATTATANLRGIRATSTSSSIWIDNCAVSVNAQNVPQGVQAWCITTGDDSSQNAIAITLDGACSFSSCTNTAISLYKSPLQLGDALSLGAKKVTVSARGLVGDVFAARTKASASAADFAGSFAPASGTAYEGWTAQVSQGASSKLAWHHETVAKNAATGTEYGSFSQAVAAAKSGDTVELTRDATVSGALSITQRDLTIKLNSHTLTVNAAGEASGSSALTKGAIAFSGKGELSFQGGAIDVRAGCEVETSSTSSSPYQGFAVTGGGTVSLSRTSATVAYTGATTTNPQVTLYGASNASGTFRMADSSSLMVRAASGKGAFGASSVAGLYGAGAQETDRIAVDSSSRVAVDNNARAIVQGQIAYPDGALTGTNSSTNADLVEFSVDPDDALYAEIQQQFKKVAKFDSPLDEAGEVHDTGIYYASSMELPSGLTVWACSDPVADDAAGKLDSVTATHFFVRANYQVPLNAYGVTSSKGYKGAFQVEGRVSASTTQGNSFGAYVPDGASWSVSEGNLSATATGSDYRTSVGNFDLSHYVSFEKAPARAVVYPADASYREVVRVKPQAAKVASAASVSPDKVAGGVSYNDLFASLNGKVDVAFSNIRNASGAAGSQRISATRGKTLAESGASLPKPADYAVGDVTYRFVGWRLSTAGSSSFAYDPTALAREVAIDANLVGVADGAIEFTAVYVPVKAGQHLVRFRIEYGVYAMAASTGAKPPYAECTGLSSDPSRLTSVSSSAYTVTFKGWARDDTGAYDYKEGETVYKESVPAVTGDVTYSARFSSELAKTTVGLYYMRKTTDGTYSYIGESVKDVDWTRDLIETTDARTKVGSSITQNGVTYTLLGWSPRVSDKEPLYTDSIPLAYDGDILSDRPVMYAIYRQAEKVYHVNFYVNGELYSTATDVAASTTLYNAWNASSNAVEPTSAAQGETFKGWNADAKASTYYRASIKKMGEIAAASDGDEINLYAIWSSATDKPADGGDTPSTPDTPGASDTPGGTPGAGGTAGGATGGSTTGGGTTGTATLPSSGGAGAALSASGGTSSLASALKSSAGEGGAADGEAADDASGNDVAALSADDGAQAADANAQDAAASQSADNKDAEDSSNAAGVIGVIVAALAAIGALVWWFVRRRTGDDLEGDDDVAAPDQGEGESAKEESIRF